MEPDIRDVADRYSGSVRFEQVNAAADPDLVRDLGVIGTPALIGYVDGVEVYRATGRRTHPELEALFAELATGATPVSGPTRADLVVRIGAGSALIVAGILIAGAWPLIAVGGAVVVATLVSFVRRNRADRS
jgi:hypothetical protein